MAKRGRLHMHMNMIDTIVHVRLYTCPRAAGGEMGSEGRSRRRAAQSARDYGEQPVKLRAQRLAGAGCDTHLLVGLAHGRLGCVCPIHPAPETCHRDMPRARATRKPSVPAATQGATLRSAPRGPTGGPRRIGYQPNDMAMLACSVLCQCTPRVPSPPRSIDRSIDA